ncbi:serine hydrolase domain-containing protein [Algoriphagus sediminis]|uniref:Serine hydrolase domain-containing protein n=1 Tax=Algoriphagus sediminis TaxID=3057113 RepID=A0ABT7YFN6_9BACT|nr:serine hydrolase domain-containing protein [Algoriphagus sediminis]MDN3205340.1 serine hydrolase domain-containing protein [Algoriphagus sediminis]
MEIREGISQQLTGLICMVLVAIGCEKQSLPEIYRDLDLVGIQRFADSLVTSRMNEYEIPGLSIGIVKDDEIIFARGYGLRDLAQDYPVTKNSIFHTASISKLFTAQGILILRDSGKLKLNSKISNILPDLDYSGNSGDITTRQLLNHTSGLPDIRDYEWEKALASKDALRNYFEHLTLDARSIPGTEYYYSNLGYNLLALIIEEVSAQSFEDFIKDNILLPYGMESSDFEYPKIPDSLKSTPYTKNWFGNIEQISNYPYSRVHAGSSTLNSSAQDISNWMIKVMKEEHLISEITSPDDNFPQIYLGFQQYETKRFKGVGHFGGDPGFRSFLLMIPSQKIGLVLLANCDYDEDFRQEIILPIANELVLN